MGYGRKRRKLKKVLKVVAAPVYYPCHYAHKKHKEHKNKSEGSGYSAPEFRCSLDDIRNNTKKNTEEPKEKVLTPANDPNIYNYNFFPEDDAPEDNGVGILSVPHNIIPAFTLNNYVFNDDGSIVCMDSSQASVEAKEAQDEDVIDYIINNETIKELVPNVKADNVVIENGMIILTVKRKGGTSVEKYRLDILNDGSLVVQAPFDFNYVNRMTGGIYHFVSVPIDSDLGRDILANENRKISTTDCFDMTECIFRFTADEI